MGYKCHICGVNDVENPGDVCELCAIGQDPYASAMGGASDTVVSAGSSGKSPRRIPVGNSTAPVNTTSGRARKVLIHGGIDASSTTDPYGNEIVTSSNNEPQVQVYGPGQVQTQMDNGSVSSTLSNTGNVQNSKGQAKPQGPITTGITKNISVDSEKRSFLQKWFKSLFSGIPFTFDDNITMFQVFPDYSGTALNAMGNACDQVVVYGTVKNGVIAENNDVEVYGHRDSNNNIIAKTIKNKASGVTVIPERVLSAVAVWIITACVFAGLAVLLGGLGMEGIMWIVILFLCLTNLPLVFKVILGIFGAFISLFKRK